jgi:hypothetical protein
LLTLIFSTSWTSDKPFTTAQVFSKLFDTREYRSPDLKMIFTMGWGGVGGFPQKIKMASFGSQMDFESPCNTSLRN